ncbi:sulfotransferase family 2 domain-containing protein [Seohaeicola saemankumensis]|nr:sulfotransferase family 2 domain-containing protein [Seohaeicola saemankumensis]MCA0873437.1 sulfotransferase family 2 domain-containing protein [Seohaeicola saemankumensis]
MQLTHLHIPKTAGTSLRESIALAHPDLSIAHVLDPVHEDVPEGADVISGHFSYDDTVRYGHPVVTVLRHPVDRFVSIYFFWRELYEKNIERTRKTSLAHHLPLLDFAKAMDEPELCSELYNRMAWQLYSDFRLNKRFEARREQQLTTQGLTDGAIAHLRDFAVVGFQDRYGDFVEALNGHFGMAIENRKVNVTQRRSAVEDLTRSELAAILAWVEADMEIYHTALKERG